MEVTSFETLAEDHHRAVHPQDDSEADEKGEHGGDEEVQGVRLDDREYGLGKRSVNELSRNESGGVDWW